MTSLTKPSLLRRLGALLVDLLIIGGAAALLKMLLGISKFELIFAFYHIGAYFSSWQATLGERLLNMKMAYTGSEGGEARPLIRAIVFCVPMCVLAVAYASWIFNAYGMVYALLAFTLLWNLPILLSKSRRGIHDRVSKTELVVCRQAGQAVVSEKRMVLAAAAAGLVLYAGMSYLGMQKANGCYDAYKKQDYATALEKCEEEAEKLDTEAMTRLGEMHLKGLGTPQNAEKAFEYYQRADRLGNNLAQQRINFFCIDRNPISRQQKQQACDSLRERADGGNPLAQSLYAMALTEGIGIEKNKKLAEDYWRASANQKFPIPMVFLAILQMEEGKNYEAYVWLKLAEKYKGNISMVEKSMATQMPDFILAMFKRPIEVGLKQIPALEAKLTPAEKAAADEAVENWKSGSPTH